MLMDQQDGGIIFANGYIEKLTKTTWSVGFMNGKINGVEVRSARGRMYLEYQTNIGMVR
jgi:hypothetical protein